MTRPPAAVTADHLTRRYRGATAVDDVSLELDAGAITGLLGRNAAGKSTLLRLFAAQEFATSGRLEVFGASPVENPRVASRTVLVREDQAYPDFKVRHALTAASWCYPNWDAALAAELVSDFEIPLKRSIKRLSRGQRSAVGIVLGLAAHADLTLLDEPYAGLDPVARRLFYDHLLADYAAHPRTILVSTHLVDEIADLVEHVLVIRCGRIVVDAPADAVRGSAVAVSGPRDAVARFTDGRIVYRAGGLGSHARATVAGPVTGADRDLARASGLTLEPLTLQEILVQEAIAEIGATGPAATGAGHLRTDHLGAEVAGGMATLPQDSPTRQEVSR